VGVGVVVQQGVQLVLVRGSGRLAPPPRLLLLAGLGARALVGSGLQCS
jgi:hypothetical protein